MKRIVCIISLLFPFFSHAMELKDDSDTIAIINGSSEDLDKFFRDIECHAGYTAKNRTLRDLSMFLTTLPVTKKTQNYIDYAHGWLAETAFKSRTNHELYYEPNSKCREKSLTVEGDNVIKRYTDEQTLTYKELNMRLLCGKLRPTDGQLAKELKSFIGWQTPKWVGKTFRGALHSPLEIFQWFHAGKFFLPSFVSTSKNINGILYEPYSETKKSTTPRQNVVIEIDNQDWPMFSTIIQKHQTDLPGEEEVLFSCFNIFKWGGLRIHRDKNNNEQIVISLKVLNHDENRDIDSHVLTGDIQKLDTAWLKEQKQFSNRYLSPTSFKEEFNNLLRAYFEKYEQKGHKEFSDWLNEHNINFTVIETRLSNYGGEINGVEVDAFKMESAVNDGAEKKQAANRPASRSMTLSRIERKEEPSPAPVMHRQIFFDDKAAEPFVEEVKIPEPQPKALLTEDERKVLGRFGFPADNIPPFDAAFRRWRELTESAPDQAEEIGENYQRILEIVNK